MFPLIGECATYQVDTVAESNALSLSSGDIVEFNSNSAPFRFIDSPLTYTDGVTYRSFGGGKAILTRSEETNLTDDWTDLGSNIWATDNDSFTTDIGNIILDNKNAAIKSKVESLTIDGSFWYDSTNDRVKFHSTSNPASRWDDIECAISLDISRAETGTDGVIIENLEFMYGGRHAINIINSSNITVQNCYISWIGGGDQFPATKTNRIGNGIQIWESATNVFIRDNVLWQIMDVALAHEGDTTNRVISNVEWIGNTVYDCGLYGLQYWQNGIGSTLSGYKMDNNTLVNSCGAGWVIGQRWNTFYYPAGIGFYNNKATINNFSIKNNVVYQDTPDTGQYYENRCLFIGGAYFDDVTELDFDNNCYYRLSGEMIKVDYPSAGQDEYTLSEFSTYQSEKSQDANSIALNPLLTSSHRLSQASPCRGAGTNNSDIGAYKYYKGFTATRGTGTITISGTGTGKVTIK